MFQRYYRWALIIGAAALIGTIIVADLVPTGRWHVATDFKKDSLWIRHLWPPGRVGEPVQLHNKVVIPITIEPVYVDVLTPRSFESVKARITFAAEPSVPVSIGVARERNVWGGVFSPLTQTQESKSSSWIGTAALSLHGIDQTHGRLQWILSAKGLDPVHPLLITSIDLVFVRPTLYQWVIAHTKQLWK